MGNIFPKIESIKTVKFTKIEHYSTAQKKNETSFLEKRYFSVKMGEKTMLAFKDVQVYIM